MLAAARQPSDKKRAARLAVCREHQRRFAETLPDRRYEEVDSGHFIQAEQPRLVADRVVGLLDHQHGEQ